MGSRTSDGRITGYLSDRGTLTGNLADHGSLQGSVAIPLKVQMDYSRAENKPAVNEHVLRAGNNTLLELGIDVCKFTDIDALFV